MKLAIPTTKADKIRSAWAAGDKIAALRIAARFFDRSDATKAFKRGMDAHNNPQFYRQLGKDPELLLRTALELLAHKFSLRPVLARMSDVVPRSHEEEQELLRD